MPYDPATGMQFDNPENTPQMTEERGTIVTFDLHPYHLKRKSEEMGSPQYEDRLYVKIVQPLNRNSEVHRPATEDDKRRWPIRWRQFQDGQEQIGTGTPLKEWPLLGPSQVMMLIGLGIKTVEQLADVSDVNLNTLGMGARELRTKAQTWLENAKDGAPLQAALAAKADLEAQRDVDRAAIKALQDQVQKLMERSNGEH